MLRTSAACRSSSFPFVTMRAPFVSVNLLTAKVNPDFFPGWPTTRVAPSSVSEPCETNSFARAASERPFATAVLIASGKLSKVAMRDLITTSCNWRDGVSTVPCTVGVLLFGKKTPIKAGKLFGQSKKIDEQVSTPEAENNTTKTHATKKARGANCADAADARAANTTSRTIKTSMATTPKIAAAGDLNKP